MNNAVTSRKKDAPPTRLSETIPIFGPLFIPPTYVQLMRRNPSGSTLTPETLYVKPVNIVHPFYYDFLQKRCPQCNEVVDVSWDGWTGQGSREVHGTSYEETALGVQLRCGKCKASKSDRNSAISTFCFTTTSPSWWERFEHWEIPRMCSPLFVKSI